MNTTTFQDADTGRQIYQLTSADSISHPTYFLQSSFLPGDQTLFFVSYRSGSAQIFLKDFPDGEARQLTHGAGIHAYSPALHPDGVRIIYTQGNSLWSVNLRTGVDQQIAAFDGAQLGEPSISADGDWLTAAFRRGQENGLVVVRTDGTSARTIPFPRTVIHPQFHPIETEWIEFSGDPAPRMHRVKRDGTGVECLYQHGNDEFIVHETFLGKTGNVVFTVWPHRLCVMDWTTREIRTVCDYNAWHIAPNRTGTKVLCDTNHPDEGLQIIDAASGAREKVCRSDSSNQGSQWKTSRYALAEDFAAARSAAKSGGNLSWMETSTDTVYGPQWTHPHPSWSSDESKVIFASDRTGITQVYVCQL